MQIVTNKPACFERLLEYFGTSYDMAAAWEKGIAITYAGVIHSKYTEIPPDVLIHEEIHIRQQAGIEPMEYVERFLADKDFRRANELEAFQAQAKYLRENVKDRNDLAKRLHFIWLSISSPLYGNMITYEEAKNLI